MHALNCIKTITSLDIWEIANITEGAGRQRDKTVQINNTELRSKVGRPWKISQCFRDPQRDLCFFRRMGKKVYLICNIVDAST